MADASVSIVVPLYTVRGGDRVFTRDADVAAALSASCPRPSIGSRAESAVVAPTPFSLQVEESADAGNWQHDSGPFLVDEEGHELVVVGTARYAINLRGPP
jgi:hypothetical protein